MGKLVAILTFERFQNLLENNGINEHSIVFIINTGLLYTHGIFINSATFGTVSNGAVPLTIAGITNTLSLSTHTHSLADLTTWGSVSNNLTASSITFSKVYWLNTPTASNQVYGIGIHPTNGLLYYIYNNKGSYSATSYTSYNNTWRNIYVNNESVVDTSTNTKALNFVAGSNVSIVYKAASVEQSGSTNYFNIEISSENTWNPANTNLAGYVPQLSGSQTISTLGTEYVLTYTSGDGVITPTWKKLPLNAFSNDIPNNNTFSIKSKIDNTTNVINSFTFNQNSNDDLTFILGDNITFVNNNKTLKISGTPNTTYKLKINNTTYGDTSNGVNLGTVLSPTSLGDAGLLLCVGDNSDLIWRSILSLDISNNNIVTSTLSSINLGTEWINVDNLTDKLSVGSYMILLTYGSCLYTGTFSYSSGTINEEIVLHCSGNVDTLSGVNRGRLYAKLNATDKTYLQLATSQAESNAIVTIKYKKLI